MSGYVGAVINRREDIVFPPVYNVDGQIFEKQLKLINGFILSGFG